MRAISAHTRLERAAVWLLVLSPFLAALVPAGVLAALLGFDARNPAWWLPTVLYLMLSWFSLEQADFWVHMDDWDHDRYTVRGVAKDLPFVSLAFLWFWSVTGLPTLVATAAIVLLLR